MKFNVYMLAVLVLLFACEDEKITPSFETEYNQITEITAEDLSVTLFAAETELFHGYNKMELKISDLAGSLVESGSVTIKPMMQMMDMSHSCPISYDGQIVNGKVSFDAFFVMPSGDMGSWSLMLTVDDGSDLIDMEIPVSVTSLEVPRAYSFVGKDESKYFVALTSDDFEVGQNDLELAIYEKVSMMDWPANDDFVVNITPWMPSMDHGSPNNEHPVSTGEGKYQGKVNFTMTGDWKVLIELFKNDELYDSFELELTL